jgi:DNA-binding transcriptional ArsR family regulator
MLSQNVVPLEAGALIVNDEPAKERILTALSDSYSRKILSATVDEPLSALEISKDYDIPITTVYRRIEELVDAGLIAAVKSGRTTDGKWYDLYRSLLLRVDVSFQDGTIRIDATVNTRMADKFTRMWTAIPSI